jgi:hypothetical protein
MHYTALQNYSVSAGRLPAQKAPAMAATYSISAASGELMIPENAGVVLQAKSGINAIRVSGTATTTAGMTGPGTTANQIQFYSNDIIVGAFDSLGLYTTGSVYTNSIKTISDNDLIISSYHGTAARAIQFTGVSSNNSAVQGRYGFCSIGGWSFEDGGSNPANCATINKGGICSSKHITILSGGVNSFYIADGYDGNGPTFSSNYYRLFGTTGTTFHDFYGSIAYRNVSSATNPGAFNNSNLLNISNGAVIVNTAFRANNNIETPLINVFGTQTSGGIFFTGDTPTAQWQIAITGGFNLGFLRNINSAGVGAGWVARFTVMSDGGLSCSGPISAVAFNTTSDVRLKKSITPLASALSSIMSINPVNFLYNHQSDDSKLNTGFIAQDLKKVIDNVVDIMDKNDENSYLGVNLSGLVPYLVKGIQEQQAEITELKLQNADFKNKLDVLKALVDTLMV